MSTKTDDPLDLPRLTEILAAEKARWANDPNVKGVNFGQKVRAGESRPGVAFCYAVWWKFASEEEILRAGSRPIPAEVDGVPTDVYVLELVRPDGPTGSRGTRKEEPLVGGTSTTVLSPWHSFPISYGTLGGICFDEATGDRMAISNAHVWGDETGREVIQPRMPVTEYLEAGVKLLACGPIASYLVDWTAPSASTPALAAAAVGVAALAVAADVEDPSRWGQRVTMPPSPGATTSTEAIRLRADYPEHPLPGYDYSVRTRWDYTRHTDGGDPTAVTEDERKNEHVLEWKRVWTDRQQYRGGERVRICAEIGTSRADRPEDYFVVAQCYPLGDRERLVPRVLVPGRCGKGPPKDRECLIFSGPATHVPPPPPPTPFPLASGFFRFVAAGMTRFEMVVVDNGPSPALTLRIPATGLRIEFPPTKKVEVAVSHSHSPVTVQALDPVGRVVAEATSGPEQRHLFALTLAAPHIVVVRLNGASGEGSLHGLCIDRSRKLPSNPDGVRVFHYQGLIDLAPGERPDRWGAILNVQTANNVPPGTDPLIAAQTIGGVTVSAETAHLAGCVVVMALDHLFDVI